MKNYYELLDELLIKANKKNIKEFIFRIIELIPENRNEEFIDIINSNFKDEIENINIKNLSKLIDDLKYKFDLINNGDLKFHFEDYETGNYNYYDDWETEYSDPEEISKIIYEAYNLANLLFQKKDYTNAKKYMI